MKGNAKENLLLLLSILANIATVASFIAYLIAAIEGG
jgi:hypothetical protein